jgi:phosphopentomutase
VLDGVGIGELPDAARFGDAGSNTLGNLARAVGGLHLPNLAALGLGNTAAISGVGPVASPAASFGKMAEVSRGKDSTTGHWELAGLVTDTEFPTFPGGFPARLMNRFLEVTGCGGFLGNMVVSGTVIINRLGDEHVKSGFPIVYTSADSVFQIAAHEKVVPLPQLYTICRETRDDVCVGEFAVGRVIARPFVGVSGGYTRTTNRRDYSLLPPGETLLDALMKNHVTTVSIGKVDDLFGGRGLMRTHHTASNREGIEAIVMEAKALDSGFVFTNLVDFDTLFGHRNDPQGFASALSEFDRELPRILDTMRGDDLLILTADHGNDPVTPSTDHSREYVPLLCYSHGRSRGANLGVRKTFADVGKTVAEYFGVVNGLAGTSFLEEVR